MKKTVATTVQIPIGQIAWYLSAAILIILAGEFLSRWISTVPRITTEIALLVISIALTVRLISRERERQIMLDLRRKRINAYLRMRAERRARNTEATREMVAHLDLVVSSVDEHILLLDPKGWIVLFNKAWKDFTTRMTGKVPQVGQPVAEVMPPMEDQWNALLGRAMQGSVFETDVHIARNGIELTHRIRHTPIFRDNVLTHIMISGRDVTEQRRAENTLKESEANLKAIFDNTSEIFVLMDDSFRIKLFNASFVHIWLKDQIRRLPQLADDLSATNIIGRSIFEFVEPARSREARQYQETLLAGGTVNYPKRVGDDDTARWFDVTMSRVTMPDGQWGYCISMLDQTAVYHAKQMLEASEKKFRGLVDNSRDFFMINNRQFVCTYASPAIKEILGYTPSEMVGSAPGKLVHPDELPNLQAIAAASQQIPDGYHQRVVIRAVHKDGSYRYLDGTATNLYNTPGIEGRLFVFRDVTTKMEQDRQVLSLNNYLSEFQRAIYHAAIVSRTDVFGRIQFVNDNFLRITGYSREELIGQTHQLIDATPSNWNEQWRTITAKKTWRGETKCRAKDGSDFWVDTFVTPLLDESGNVREYLLIRNDITERKIAEEATKRNNERFELAAKAAQEAIWDWDIENNTEVWNHGLKTIFGYDLHTILTPQSWWEAKVHPDDIATLRATIEGCFRDKKEHWSQSYRYLCADGSYKDVFDRAYIVFRDGKPVRMIGAMQDVTQETQSRAEVEKLSLVARQTSNAIIIANQKNEIEWVNESFTRLTGYELNEVAGLAPLSVLSAANIDDHRRITEAIQKNGSIDEEIPGLTRNQVPYWQRLMVQTVFDDEHRPRHYIYLSTDITDQKNFEAHITATARELVNLIDNANVPIFVIDRQAKVKQWNKVASTVTGFEREEMNGNGIGILLDPETDLKLQLTLHDIFSGSSINNYELPIRNKNGKVINLFAALTPTIDVSGEITGATIVAQDLTELLQYRNDLESLVTRRTDELNAALQKEKETVEMKSRFVSVASHEFRTPLTNITVANSTIRKFRKKMSDTDLEEKLNTIDKQVRHMTWLLDDVLMVGKADAGKIKVANASMGFRQFLDKIAEEVSHSTFNTHRIQLEVALHDESVFTDEKLMRNILINLLTNAIKFSPGQPKVVLRVNSTASDLQIVVADSGIGIPKDDLSKVFNSFQRGSNTDHIEGTGLGLAIVKKAVELLGGTVTVESELGQGTTFFVHVPIESLRPNKRNK